MLQVIEGFASAMASGAVAGFSVDVILYPVDTVKTRLQSKGGFFYTGGFRRLYSGIGSVLLGSMPGAALFFTSYESVRTLMQPYIYESMASQKIVIDMSAASLGEICACLVRVPVEVIKQRTQVHTNSSSLNVFYQCIREEGYKGLYRGYKSTVLREIPFSIIQFPLWELSKFNLAKWQGSSLSTLQSACCGFVAGAIAAATTTPLDVAKTRIMLAQKQENTASGKIVPVLRNIWKNEGFFALFSGIYPRVVLISFGGFIFLGAYDFMQNMLKSNTQK